MAVPTGLPVWMDGLVRTSVAVMETPGLRATHRGEGLLCLHFHIIVHL